MSQDPPRGDTEVGDGTMIVPPRRSPAGDETMIGQPAGATQRYDVVPPPPPAAAPSEETCEGCGQRIEGDGRFCQTCGREVRTGLAEPARAEQPTERLRPWVVAVGVVWLVIMVAALYFIYANAISIGSV